MAKGNGKEIILSSELVEERGKGVCGKGIEGLTSSVSALMGLKSCSKSESHCLIPGAYDN